jgi:transcriptional regulator with GAF, ATPase, and Fis domain
MDTQSSKPNLQTEDLLFINALNEILVKGGSMEDLQKHISSETRRLFSSHEAMLYTVSEDKNRLTLLFLDFMPGILPAIETLMQTHMPKLEVQLSPESIFRRILEEKKPLIINDPNTIIDLSKEVTDNPRFKAIAPQAVSLIQMKSLMMVPMIYKQEPIGLLEISRGTPFTEEELSRFQIMASQICSILVKKKMDDLLVDQKKELEEMNQLMIGREIKMADLKAENERLKQQIATPTASPHNA